ncbi:MAG: GTP 3',8-cyclase MoaA [Blastocatellia bacterium]|nr:MAG: GTP 3',8-cyclase MoaA [Blastocatellia bacterium]
MLIDTLSRPLRNLRLSVTDRCNIRCEYCMPEQDYVWLPREDMLHFEEISALVDLFIECGVDKVRLTGGEPLLRRDLSTLVRLLAAKPGLRDLALTTNGILLGDQIDALKGAGLRRVTISLDTLHRDRFARLTRFDQLAAVLAGIDQAERVFESSRDGEFHHHVKIDTVVIRGVNDDELIDLLDYGKSKRAEVRFIEYMDVGGATHWSPDRVVSRAEILATIAQHYGKVEPIVENTSAPAERFALPDGATFGIIASTTAPFCRTCDRSRLTADGLWYLCLYAAGGLDLRGALRRGASAEELKALITSRWQSRSDRGAEQRLELGERRAFVPIGALRKDPHLEMHTRGG